MLNEGVELAFISKVTDLSLADLKRLQEKNKRLSYIFSTSLP